MWSVRQIEIFPSFILYTVESVYPLVSWIVICSTPRQREDSPGHVPGSRHQISLMDCLLLLLTVWVVIISRRILKI